MNAHQRRVHARRVHMLLPLSAEVQLKPLLGREVYVYGLISANRTLDSAAIGQVASATVAKHCRTPHTVDLELTSHDGETATIQTTLRGIRLVNPADRKPRPWWAELRRRNRAAARARNR